MLSNLFSIVVLFFSTVLAQNPLDNSDLIITGLSNSPVAGQGDQYSSLGGGNTFYITGTGWDPILSNNYVFIGPYQAKVLGVNSVFLIFESLPMTSEVNMLVSVVVMSSITKQQKTSKCSINCNIYYRWGVTSEFYSIKPKSAGPTEYINFYGIERFATTASIKSINMGPFICDRIGLFDDTISSGSVNPIQCRVALELVAGNYGSSFLVENRGYSVNLPNFQGIDNYGSLYDFRCIPYITSISNNVGSPNGQLLSIYGFGFSSDSSSISVTAGDYKCSVLSSNKNQINCQVGTVPLNQSFFIKGSGIERWVYDGTNQNALSISNGLFQNMFWAHNVTLPLLSYSIQNALELIPESDDTNFVEGYQAYFRPLYTGNYRFYLASDDNGEIWLSNVSNSSNTSYLNKIAYHYSYCSYGMPYYYDTQRSAYIPLVAGQYYLMNVFHNQYTGPTNLWVGLEAPYANSTPLQTYSVQKINITYNPIREVQQLTINSYKANNQFTIVVRQLDANGKNLFYKATNPINYNTTASNLQSRLSSDLGFSTTVTSYPIDQSGNVITNTTNLNKTTGYTYFINFTAYRTPFNGVQLQPFVSLVNTNDYYVTYSMKQIVAPSAPITGNMTFNLNGTLISIPGNSTYLYPYFASITALDRGFYTEIDGSCYDNHYYIIKFSGFSNCPIMLLQSNGLTGGVDQPVVQVTELIHSSNNLYYDPIPNEMLFSLSNTSQVIVNISSSVGKCPNNNCSYVINSTMTPRLVSFNLTTTGLSLNLSNYSYVTINNLTTLITFAGANCAVQSVSLPIVLCSIALNSNNSLSIEAGSHIPRVHITGIGFTTYGPNVTNVTVPLNYYSVNSTFGGSTMGGQILNISGSGFPLPSNDKSRLNVQIGGVNCPIVQSASSYVVVTVPPKGASTSSNLVLSMESMTVTATTYTYNNTLTPTISSVSPATSSPSQKAVVTINGSGFGNNASLLTVLLSNYSNNSINYQLSIINVTLTSINAILGGGLAGVYKVQIVLAGVGNSIEATTNSSLFSYDLSITSVSPVTGSIYGGTLITIMGSNFSPVLTQNQVFIGDVTNNFCNVIFSNFTCIICQTTLAPTVSLDIPQTVFVTQRVQDNAVCRAQNGCKFTFVSSLSPQITAPSLTSQAGSNVTLAGTNLAPSGSNSVTVNFINGTSQNVVIPVNCSVNASQFNSTAIVFLMPALREGVYNIQVVINNYGWAFINSSFTITNPIVPTGLVFSYAPMNLSSKGSYGGMIVTVLGNGFYNESIVIGSSIFGIVYSINATAITFSTNRLSATGYPVYVYRSSKSKYTCNNCTLTATSTNVPKVTTHNCSSASMGSSFILNATGTLLNNTNFTILATLDYYNTTTNYMISSINGTILVSNASIILISFSNIPMGSYIINIYYTEAGFAYIPDPYRTISVTASAVTASVSSVQSSFMGGPVLSLKGSGFPVDWTNTANNNISICGSLCPVVSSSITSVSCAIPGLTFAAVANYYNLTSQLSIQQTNYVLTSDNPASQANANDNKLNTMYDSASPNCYLMFDFGSTFNVNLTQIQYYPSLSHQISDFYGMKFQASNDNNTFLDLFVMDQNIKTGWNTWNSNMTLPVYRYIKVLSNTTSPLSRCNFAEVALFGIANYYASSTSLASTSCNTLVQMAGTSVWLNNTVVYTQTNTPVVQSINPPNGPTSGGTVVILTGTGFGTDATKVNVVMDGNACIVNSVTATTVNCTTAARPMFVPSVTQVFVNGNLAVINTNPFTYINRWSDPNTWGGEAPPRDGDSVYIPAGQNVLLDVSTPILYSVIIEGSLIFEDKDKTFDAYYLVCMMGTVQIGTYQNPFLSKLTITMHGSRMYPPQLPEYGNKVWAFHDATLDMHGRPKKVTWTVLASTAQIGAVTITLAQAVDWSVGDLIAIASSDFNHFNSEKRSIAAISSDNKTLTLNSPLNNRHYSAIEKYGSANFPMQTEVALLTRNILFQGSTDDVKVSDIYGAHIMLHMAGSVGRISYTSFTNVGQGFIIGRYPMHFHLIKDASASYVIGNAVYNSFARVVTIHDTNFLTVQWNVGYYVYGHNYFLEDGIETNNLIENNLGISTIQIWTLIMTDTTAATFWISNPNNIVRNNRAAGGDWFGFWYQLDNMVTGPSSNPNICPDGVTLGVFTGNVAHSYNQGLRVFEYVPRTFPCIANDDTSYFQSNVWYAANPSIHVVFRNFTTWKNIESGLVAQQIGSVEFNNFLIAESGLAGIQIEQTNFTTEDQAVINGVIIVGLGQNADPDPSKYNQSVGILTPRTDFLLVNNVSFYNFISAYNMTAFVSCAVCWHPKLKITGGKTTKFSNLAFTNVSRKIIWNGTREEIYVDLDGTLTGTGKPNMLTPLYAHLSGIPECTVMDPTIYDYTVSCNSSIQLRSVMFRNMIPNEMFRGLELRVARIPNLTYNISLMNYSNFTREVMYKIKIDTIYAWDLVFATGYQYNLHWQDGGLDFSHMNIYPSPVWKPTDKGIVFRFNYSSYRENYLIKVIEWNGTLLNTTQYNQTNTSFNAVANNYSTGSYILDNNTNLLSMGINGILNGTVDVDAIICQLYCPVNNKSNGTEDFTRLWSNASMWPNSTLPQAGDVVVIPPDWNVKLDVDPPTLDRLLVQGNLVFDPSRNLSTLTSALIWVSGNLTAGAPGAPFPNKILINITGSQHSPPLVINNMITATSKMIAVTGSLQLYGVSNSFSWTKLKVIANPGDTKITVLDNVDWKVGDEIIIAPTEQNTSAFERKTITAIAANVITLDSPIQNYHYGDTGVTYTASFGTVLDMRAGVGLLTRSIHITTDPSSNWGHNIVVTQYTDVNNVTWRGFTTLVGVEISNGGQPSTEQSSLDIMYVLSPGNMSTLANSSIHDGLGWCMYVQSSVNVTIKNNVFFNCEKFLTRGLNANYFYYISNLLIAPRMRHLNISSDLYDMVAGLDMYIPMAANTGSNILIFNNTVQGGDGNGFVLPGCMCGDNYTGFKNNYVNSMTWAGLILNLNNTYCFEATDFSVATSYAAVISNFNGKGLSLQRTVFAENQFASKVWYGNEADENSLTYTNMVILAMARPNCTYCYKQSSACSNQVAIYIPIVQIHGKAIPIDKPTPADLLSQCIDSAFDSKMVLNNVTFVNYKLNYSQDSNPNYASCKNNLLFMQPGVPDAASRIFMAGSSNVNGDSLAIIQEQGPNLNFLGWKGGCGDMNCTGNENYLVTDLDGSFFGYKGQIVPQNPGIKSPKCTDVNQWNARMCTGINFGIMEFQNDGPDQRQRNIFPLNVSSQYMYTTLNEWREWQWLGPTPLNKRLGRFNAIVEVNKSLELQYQVTVPEQMKFKLESRPSNWWVIVSQWYERPNVIEVWNMNTNTFIAPYRPDQNMDLTTMTDQCGANIYDSKNCTIAFVLNNQPNCVLKVRTINAIKITMHLTTTVEDFYSNDGQTTFIDKISAFLGLDMGRIRIAGITTGSTIVDFAIVEKAPLQNSTSADDSLASNTTNSTPNASQIQQFNSMVSELTSYGDTLTQAVNNGSFQLPAALGNVTGIVTQLVVTNITGNGTSNQSNNTNNTNNTTTDTSSNGSNLELILLSTLIPGVFILALLVLCCVKNKDGITLITLALNYKMKRKTVDVSSFNQELMKKSDMEIDQESHAMPIPEDNKHIKKMKIDYYVENYMDNAKK